MDINDFLSLDTFPKSYEACFLENCAVREDCLHHLYFKLRPTSNIWGDAIFPSALMLENLVNGRCRMFHAKKLVTCYAYFRGRSNFYRYGKAERGYLYTQSMAEDVKALFMKYGYNEPKYERTFESISFY